MTSSDYDNKTSARFIRKLDEDASKRRAEMMIFFVLFFNTFFGKCVGLSVLGC